MTTSIRAEAQSDVALVRHINESAFETAAEAGLVDVLREAASPLVSLVAEDAGSIAGHILFTPVTVAGFEPLLMGLGPMAVDPGRQRGGIGSLLVREGLSRCRDMGAAGVIVLGHPAFYPRFGFRPASHFGITSDYDVPDEVFMALEFEEGGLDDASGTAHYHPAFAAV